MLTTVIPDNGL